ARCVSGASGAARGLAPPPQSCVRSRRGLQSAPHVSGVLTMETRLADFIRDTPEGREADAILRACVHCGFCTATCPTYQLLGDELDGPRGRIYLIKQMLEGGEVSASTQLHLDRCLSCRACETTCPSGVRYGRLADIGRHVVEGRVGRRRGARIVRWLLGRGLSQRGIFA